MQWTKGILVPERLRLRATTGPAGARAARVLYRQRLPKLLASTSTRGRSLALTRGIGRPCDPPVEGFDELCDLLTIAPVGAAAIQSSLAERLVLCILGLATSVVVKVGPRLDPGLSTEAAMLGKLEGSVGAVLVPRVRWYGVWRERMVLATEAIQLADRQRDVTLEEGAEAATALCLGSASVGPVVHGDLAPWNLLRTPIGLALVDWEEAQVGSQPLFDLAHFVVTRGALLRSGPPERAVSQLTSPNSSGWKHLEALGVDPSTASTLLREYLEQSKSSGLSWEYRRAMLRRLDVTAPRAAVRPAPADVTAARGAEPPSPVGAPNVRTSVDAADVR